MSEVKRYGYCTDTSIIKEREYGSWVEYSDYKKLEAQLTRVCEWHEVSCYDELPFVIDELREGETALNGEGK